MAYDATSKSPSAMNFGWSFSMSISILCNVEFYGKFLVYNVAS